MNRTRLVTIAFLCTLVLHALAQFVSWAGADAIRSPSSVRIVFAVLSFPAFYLVSPNVATQWFWPTFLVNSAVWAAVCAAAVAAIKLHHEATVPPN